MPLYYGEYEILPEHRSDCMTYFGGMSKEDDVRDCGKDIKLLGRWGTVGEAKGCFLAESTNARALSDWLYNWITMATCKVWPIVDDNQAREIILGKEPSFKVDFSNINSEATHGESLYWIKYKFQDEKRAAGYEVFANMTKEQDENDSGDVKCLGRYHNLGMGWGVAIASSKSEVALYKWAYNWTSMCDCEIVPVCHDNELRSVVQGKPDYEIKKELLYQKMAAITLASRANMESKN